jgi:hypothetical protein
VAYGSLGSDTTDVIMKQGLNLPTVTLNCPAPGTTGMSIVYLIEAAYQDVDSVQIILPYYNASNPTQAYAGPSNSGVAQNTVRTGVCSLVAKAGIAATTGTQVAPSPDAGYVGLYTVTVAFGQTSVTSGNIATLAAAPFIATKLNQLGIGSGLVSSGGLLSVSTAVNAQTGTTYTFLAGDNGKLVTFSNAAATAVGLPAASTTGFGAGATIKVTNLGVGIVTITPTTSTINGGSSITLQKGQGVTIISDGTNYETVGALQGVNFSGTGIALAANTTLTASQMGNWAQVQAANVTATLPPLSSVSPGATITFVVGAQSGFTIKANGSEIIQSSTATQANTYLPLPGETVTLAANGTGVAWYVVEGGFSTPSFSSSKVTSGYQKLPSGLIIQWGITAASITGGSMSATFPIAFPNTCLFAAGASTANSAPTAWMATGTTTTTGATFWNAQASGSAAAAGQGGSYIAIGF